VDLCTDKHFQTLGLLVGSMVVAMRVVKGDSKPSDFVIFITYLAQVRFLAVSGTSRHNLFRLQLYAPLNSLGYIYRSINQSLVDTEKLLKLLNEPTEVNDKPNAPDLIVEDGEIEFGMLCPSVLSRRPLKYIFVQTTSAFLMMAVTPLCPPSRSKYLRTAPSH
jgi:ABC-type transport system involved in Fe-S cluster assembly fused permease/ATPase subunit